MFKITLSPQFDTTTLEIIKQGDTLIINGDELDFSDLQEGGSYPAEAIDNPSVVGGISRIDGVVHITITLPYSLANPQQSITFPEPVMVTNDGRVPLPTDGVEDDGVEDDGVEDDAA